MTAADHASEAVMIAGISRLLPGISVVSEEAVAGSPPSNLSCSFVLADPLDGTRELLAGRDEFTINLALVSGGSPRLGIIAAPAWGVLWRWGFGGRPPPGRPPPRSATQYPPRPPPPVSPSPPPPR